MTDTDAFMIGVWIFLLVGGGIGAFIFSIFAIKREMKKRGLSELKDDRNDSDK